MEQYDPQKIIKCVETNVDGCGTDVPCYVQCTAVITPDISSLMQTCLDDAKRQRDPVEDYTTDDYMNAAVELFNSRTADPDVKMTFISPPYADELEF